MALGPETLGLKDTQLLALREAGGPRSNAQIHTFLPNSASAPFFVWAGNAQGLWQGSRRKAMCWLPGSVP